MPSTSKKQHKFMNAVAHSPAFAKKAGVPQSVGKDFIAADKGRKFSKGGDMKTDKKTMTFAEKVEADNRAAAKEAELKAAKERAEAIREKGYKKGGAISEYGGAETYKSKAAMKKHEAKESPAMEKSEKMMAGMAKKVSDKAVKGHEQRMHKGMAKGGSIDGCAIRGKTKGRMV